ncbi:type II toxin-antitoxin system VapC family toxin [Spirosoma koreense]
MIDTNAAIDYLAELLPASGLSFIDGIFDSNGVIISVITQIELMGFQAPEAYLDKCQKLIDIASIILLADLATIERAIQVRRETKIKLPDAIIASTALVHSLTVVSRNEKDFSRVDGLKWINRMRYRQCSEAWSLQNDQAFLYIYSNQLLSS